MEGVSMEYFVTVIVGDAVFHRVCEPGERIVVGSGKKDTFLVPELQKNDFRINIDYDEYSVFANRYNIAHRNYYNNSPDIMVLSEHDPFIAVIIGKYNGFSKEVFSLPYYCRIRIGKGREFNDIVLNRKYISKEHLVISSENGVTRFEDIGSTYGTFLNGKRVRKGQLKTGDILSLMDICIHYKNTVLQFENVGSCLHIPDSRANGAGNQKKEGIPEYSRSPRVREALPSEPVILAPPPSKPGKARKTGGVFSSLVSSGAMMVAGLAMGAASPAFLAARAAGMISPISSVISHKTGYSRSIRDIEEYERMRREKYGAYIEEQYARIQTVSDAQRRIIKQENPDPHECLRIVNELSPRLWERRPEDNDFLHVRIGNSYEPLCVEIKSQENPAGFTMETDEMRELIQEIIEDTRVADDIPARVDLRGWRSVGIFGERQAEVCIIKNILTELCTAHAERDLRIVGLFDYEEMKVWEELRWLPHIWDESRQMRYLAFDREERKKLADYLHDSLKSRFSYGKSSSGNDPVPTPHYLFLIGSPDCLKKTELEADLTENNIGKTAVTSVYLYNSKETLPAACEYLVHVRMNDSSEAYPARDINSKNLFTMDEMLSYSDFSSFVRRMFGIRLNDISARQALPKSVSFLDGLKAKTVEDLDIAALWERCRYPSSLAAPMAVRSDGKAFLLDIVCQGPHGLVVGTTRYGKSELMTAWILSIATHYHPYDVNFVVVDFKGESFAGEVAALPHVVGIITNIGPGGKKKSDVEIERDVFRTIQSLNHELNRRETLFASVGVKKITEYQKAYCDGRAKEVLPYLIIVADEFAQFKKSHPDLMKKFIDVAVVGAALGVHMVLATQEPSGIIDDQISANTNLRICLKVMKPATSREVIGRGDAVQISTPGRAYIRVGNDEIFELVQSYYSGADYRPDHDLRPDASSLSARVSLSGERTSITEKKDQKMEEESKVVTRHILRTAKALGMKKLPAPWYADLPAELFPCDLNCQAFDGSTWESSETIAEWGMIPVGRYDIPKDQAQGTLMINPIKDGHLAVYGGPGSGKTTFLKSVASEVCRNYRPDEMLLYVVDFGGWHLTSLRDFPHVGDVVLDEEEEKLTKLFQMLKETVSERKKLFYKHMVGTLSMYRRAVSQDLPGILVLIDNLPSMIEMYPSIEDIVVQLVSSSAPYGISFIFTSGAPTTVKYKITAKVKSAVAFELVDKGDYNMTVGHLDEGVALSLPGRGYIKAKTPIEFQAVLFAEGEDEVQQNKNLIQTARRMREIWQGKLPPRIPVMPDQVNRDDLQNAMTDVYHPLFGLSYDAILPTGFSLDQEYCAVITGSVGCGKSKLLESTTKMIKTRFPEAKLYIFDSDRGSLKSLKGVAEQYAAANNSTETSAMVSSLAQELNPRLSARDKAKASGDFDPGSFSERFSPIVMVMDDIHSSFSLAEQDTWNKLEKISRGAKNLGLIILAAGRIADLNKDSVMEPVTRNLIQCGRGLALSDSPSLYKTVFSFTLSYEENTKNFGKGNAMLVEDGVCRKIRLPDCE